MDSSDKTAANSEGPKNKPMSWANIIWWIQFVMKLLDIATNFIFYFEEVLGDEFQNSGNSTDVIGPAHVNTVTTIALILLWVNTLLDVWFFQYQWGIIKVLKLRKKKVRPAARRDFRKFKLLSTNPFYEAMNVAFTVLSVLLDDVTAIILTAIVTGGSYDSDFAKLNLAVSVVSMIGGIVYAISIVVRTVTKISAQDIAINRLSAGKITKADQRITGKLSVSEQACIALALFVPTLGIYFAAIVPFFCSFFSPKVLYPFIEYSEKLAARRGNKKSAATVEETDAALVKVLQEAVMDDWSFLLLRVPYFEAIHEGL